mgnify:CR=1 FL=1
MLVLFYCPIVLHYFNYYSNSYHACRSKMSQLLLRYYCHCVFALARAHSWSEVSGSNAWVSCPGCLLREYGLRSYGGLGLAGEVLLGQVRRVGCSSRWPSNDCGCSLSTRWRKSSSWALIWWLDLSVWARMAWLRLRHCLSGEWSAKLLCFQHHWEV